MNWQYTPGSDAALCAGCLCPIMDNCHGKYAPFPGDGWWISERCPLHSPSLTEEYASGREQRHTDTAGTEQ
jgi:hypothetical protein